MSHFLTQNGLQELEHELKQIDEVIMPKILEGLNEALGAGDLSENSARDGLLIDQKNQIDRRQQIEEILKDYTLIEESSLSNSKNVKIGNTVKIEFINLKKTFTVKILGSSEADILNNKVSNEAPLITSILGKKVGSEITFKNKNGVNLIKIIDIL